MIVIHEITVIRAPIERCFDLARSVEVHLLGNTHWNESAVAVGGRTSGLIDLGDQVTWRARHFWTWHTLTSRITKMQRPAYFQDAQVRGIFRSMVHDHLFRMLPGNRTEMKDVFAFEAPLPLLGRAAELLFLRKYMSKLLHERNQVIQQVADCDEWRKYLV